MKDLGEESVSDGGHFCENSPRRDTFVSDCERMDNVGNVCEGFLVIYTLGVLILLSLLIVICHIRRK